MPETLADRIDSLLPQTQCTRCGFDDCRAYAEALAANKVPLNRCPPGGTTTIANLAILLKRPPLALDAEVGPEEDHPVVAFVREAECIGCFKCADICPVDAIVGAPKLMHTVIEVECTGCALCLPACPVDCIMLRPRMVDASSSRERALHSRRRYSMHVSRKTRPSMGKTAGARQGGNSQNGRDARIRRYLAAARMLAMTARERNQ